ncbi:hypothetical protein BAY1663_00587 [Pseudomonas sp. BAY1663]|nr:hypothetical protein BAY1663_00587 [Pseudomonas sp. BAY1663]
MTHPAAEYKAAIDDLTIHPHTPSPQQVACHGGIFNEPRLIKDGCDWHVLIGHQFDFRQIFRQLAILHSITSRAMRSCRRLLAMEARNDFFSQLDLDITRIRTMCDVNTKCIDLLDGAEAEQLEVAPHQRIGYRHQLAIHDTRRLLDADVVAEGLGHLLDTIKAFKKRHRNHALRFLPVRSLQLTPHQQVELLIGATKLDIGLERHRVISLDQRIKELVNGDRLVTGVALAEIIALEHARNGVLRGEPDEVGRRELVHPGRIERHLGLCRIENLEHLGLVGLGILEYLVTRQGRPGSTFATWITNHPREIPYKEDHLMPQILKLAHLVDEHGMAQMKVGSGRIEPRLDTQRLAPLQLGDQFGLDEHFISAPLDHRQLLFNRLHGKSRTENIKGDNITRSPAIYKPHACNRPADEPFRGLPPLGFAYILDSYFRAKTPEA